MSGLCTVLYKYSFRDVCRPILHQLVSGRMIRVGHVARMAERINAYRNLVANPEGKRPLERPSCRWEDDISMDLKEVRHKDVGWIRMARDRGH